MQAHAVALNVLRASAAFALMLILAVSASAASAAASAFVSTGAPSSPPKCCLSVVGRGARGGRNPPIPIPRGLAPPSLSLERRVGGPPRRRREGWAATTVALSHDPEASGEADAVLSIELEKPLGIILEEIEEGAASGVRIAEVAEGGSARASPRGGDRLVGMALLVVGGEDVSKMTFDDVMERIVEAPSPVSLELGGSTSDLGADDEEEEEKEEEEEPAVVSFDVGTPVTITVIQEGKDTALIDSRVGDNLRKTLLANDVELYRGLKKKLGNCGGGGQCTFCAVDFVEGEGWEPRSEYEEGKIGKYPTARLACMNNIQGPATIRVQ